MSQNNPITISSWSLGDQCSLEERIKAAKSAGFEGIGLRAENYVDALDAGLSDEDMLALLQKYEIRVTELDIIPMVSDFPIICARMGLNCKGKKLVILGAGGFRSCL